jgi:hypothetical protein
MIGVKPQGIRLRRGVPPKGKVGLRMRRKAWGLLMVFIGLICPFRLIRSQLFKLYLQMPEIDGETSITL